MCETLRVYAYGRPMPRVAGKFDFRVCYRASFWERERSLQALSWTIVPDMLSLNGETTPLVVTNEHQPLDDVAHGTICFTISWKPDAPASEDEPLRV